MSFCLIFHGVFKAIVSATAVQGTDEGEILSRICFFRYDNSITSEDSVNRHKLEITREILDLLGDSKGAITAAHTHTPHLHSMTHPCLR